MTTPAPAHARIEIWRDGNKEISDISEDVLEELTITRPILRNGISGAMIKIVNDDGSYTDAIKRFDDTKIFLWREGISEKEMFAGKIVATGGKGDIDLNKYTKTLTCEDYGQEMLAPPSIPFKKYSGEFGYNIIAYLVGLCPTISLDGADNGAAMMSIHELELKDSNVLTPITDLLKKGQDAFGNVGFMGYIDPDAKLHVFKKGAHSSSVDLTDKILRYTTKDDVHRVRNRQTVYGSQDKTLPTNSDLWCEYIDGKTAAERGWTATYGTPEFQQNGAHSGNHFVQVEWSATWGNKIKQSLPDVTSVDCSPWKRQAYKKLVFYLLLECDTKLENIGNCYVDIHAPDEWNYYRAYMNGAGGQKKIHKFKDWIEMEFPFEDPVDVDTSPTWQTKLGDPDLSNVQAVELYLSVNVTDKLKRVKIDGFYFADASFHYTANDTASQAKYGVRCGVPITDPSLKSNVECSYVADAELARLKEEVRTIDELVVEGDYNLEVGYLQTISLPIENIDEQFYITQLKHVMRYTKWETQIAVAKEV